MWQISSHPLRVLAISLLCGVASGTAQAQEANSAPGQPIVIPSQSSVYNQNSVSLPSAPNVSGQDIVRGADGTSCQSAVASGGPYVDMGVIGSQDFFSRESSALYGRIVVPLGKRARRVDCTRLYELEISRMKMEIELLRMGTMMPMGEGPGPLIGASLTESIDHSDQPSLAGSPSLGMEDDLEPQGGGFFLGGAPVAQDTYSPPLGVDDNVDVASAQPLTLTPPVEPDPMPAADPAPVIASTPSQLVAVAPTLPPISIVGHAAPMAAALTEAMAEEPLSRVPSATHFVQLGAFSTWERAEKRLDRAPNGRADGAVRAFYRDGRTLYRALLGPMSRAEAVAKCDQLQAACFVAGG